MQARKWLTVDLRDAVDKSGRVTVSLVEATDLANLAQAPRLFAGIRHAANCDNLDIQHVENIMLGRLLYYACSTAAAISHIHGQTFDPAAFGAFAEQIAREFASTFEAVHAEEESATATKN